MSSLDVKDWQIFSLLDPKFISKIHMAIVFGNLGNEALLVTKDGTVYGLGSNTSGCLGTGDNQSTLEPKKIEALSEEVITTFAYGKGPHVLALTNNGKVYSWGHNGCSELGNGTTNQGLTPTLVGMNLTKKFIVNIACGSHHSLALTDDGEVYAWGENNSGQVGSSISKNQNAPRKVNSTLSGKKVVSITCGQSSSMAITENGELYGWGSNGVGQLGIGHYVNQVDPCKITALVGVFIEKVMCGYTHTLALTDKGAVYVWGGNNYGQLGIGSKTNVCLPVELVARQMGRVLDIAASHCSDISVAMGEGNKIFMWGLCLGQSVTVPVLTPLEYIHHVFACYASPSVMYEPLIRYGDEEEMSLTECFKEAFDDASTSDLTIRVKGKPINVHKAVLEIRSQYFRTMFQKLALQNDQSVIEHYQFTYDTYRTFLKYLYTDEIDASSENLLELLDLAMNHNEDVLKRRCMQMMRKGITVTNVAFLYSTAIQYNAKELEECCFKFALNHMTEVIQTRTFASLDDATTKTFIIRAAQAGAFKT